MFESMTEGEFLQLSEKYRHRKAAQLLRSYHETQSTPSLNTYRRVEKWLQLPPFNQERFPELSDRYHFHLTRAEVSWKEHNLLATFRVSDRPSAAPTLPVHIYLDHLRSAHNVGSILRTAEAFRFDTIYFSQNTPFATNEKVQKTSMQTYDKINCKQIDFLAELPRPLIALETDPLAPTLFEFDFPPSFTLMLGNEEYGLSDHALSQRDGIVSIPLYGFKNSLNVASAFAIAAAVISNQLRRTT